MSDITANVVVSMPSQLFTLARSFKANANGKIYIGAINTDPVTITDPTNQIQVYLENEDGSHVPVSQPLIINAGGYPVYNGQIAKFVTVQGHSMAIYDAYGTQQFYYPNVLKYDPDQLRQELESTNGASAIGTSNGMSVQQIIERGTIYIDDLPGVTTDGSADCAAAINDLLNQIRTISGRRWVVRILGTRGATYRLDSTIDTTAINNLEIDFCLSTVLDNVQGVLSTGRSNHTFLAYNNKSVKFKNIIYTVSPTRSNNFQVTGISTCPFWVGGQYLGNEETIGTEIDGFYATNSLLDGGMAMAIMGETYGFKISNVHISGGLWKFGINMEWGTAPVDPATDATDSNGRHPHDGIIESFNGENLGTEGFLRTAAAYNIKFINCNGVDVKGFIYLYSGDKGISRCSGTIIVENCKGRLTTATTGVVNLVTVLYLDNLNGSSLPSYINNEAFIYFNNCEFVGNLSNPTSCLRIIGNKGRTKFENCAIRDAYQGINADNNANVTYAQNMSLELEGCTFSGNFIHLRVAHFTGYKVAHCKFINQSTTANTYGIVLGAAANYGLFEHNYFSGSNAQSHIGITNGIGNKFYDNIFIPYNATTPQIATNLVVYGRNNVYSGGILVGSLLTDFRVIGESATGLKSLDLITGNTVNFECADFVTSSSSATVNAISSGINGSSVQFRGIATGSSVTFQHAASGVSLGNRIILKSGGNETVSGNAWSKRFMRTDNGWYEM